MRALSKENYFRIALCLGGSNLIFCTSTFFLGVVLLAIGAKPSCYIACFSLLLSMGYVLASWRALSPGSIQRNAHQLILCSLCAGLISLTVIIVGYFYDVSYDGQTYQQEAILQLADGWNPLRDHPLGLEKLGVKMSAVKDGFEIYPKFPWLSGYSIFATTENLESAKALHLLLIEATFLLCLAALLSSTNLGIAASLLGAVILSANPVAVTQSLSFYVDGLLASLLTSTIALTLIHLNRPSHGSLIALLSASVLLLNTKFILSIVYFIFLALMLLAWLYKEKRDTFPPFLRIFSVSFILGVGLLGFHPWITTLIEHPEIIPFFVPTSITGETSKDFILLYNQLPSNFHGLNRFEKFFFSLFGEPILTASSSGAVYRDLLSLNNLNHHLFAYPDVRIAGFGALFAYALLLCLILLPFSLMKKDSVVLLSSSLLVLALINPECWWARYVPFVWLIPAVIAISIVNQGYHLTLKIIAGLVLAIMLVNSMWIAKTYLVAQLNFTKEVIQQIQSLKQPIVVDFSTFRSTRWRLANAGIDYSESLYLKCDKPSYFLHSHAKFCEEKH